MREATAVWLNPMMEAAEEAGIDTRPLMKAAMMPAAEADFPPEEQGFFDAVASVEGLTHSAIDWIRFGELLRERLGWHDYPEYPEPEADE